MNRLLVLLFFACFFVGCSGSDDTPVRRIVEGQVLYQQQPVANGTIRFVPQTKGPVATARIIDGAYRVENKGGVPLGKHRIEIISTVSGTELVEAEVMPDKNSKPLTAIPKKYNKNSKMNAIIKSGKGAQELDFTLD